MDVIADKLESNWTIAGWAGPRPLIFFGVVHQYAYIPAQAAADTADIDAISPTNINFGRNAGLFARTFGGRLFYRCFGRFDGGLFNGHRLGQFGLGSHDKKSGRPGPCRHHPFT